ncbi:hypothetical protein RCL1_003093 [Eukaryota sp. TZLM3-RCL]
MDSFKTASAPDNSSAVVNKVWLNPSDYLSLFGNTSKPVLCLSSKSGLGIPLLYSAVGSSDKVKPSTIGLNEPQRTFLSLRLDDNIYFRKHDVNDFAPIATITLKMKKHRKTANAAFEADQITEFFKTQFLYHVFSPNQPILVYYESAFYVLSVESLETADMASIIGSQSAQNNTSSVTSSALLVRGSQIVIETDRDSGIVIKGSTAQNRSILSKGFDPVEFGIGGLESQFSEIFQRALVRRMLPPDYLKKLNLQHVKGILLYGPPGTGKTLTARKLAEVLNCRTPIVKSAPEILNKYVGESEKNVRDLFSEAEKEYQELGDASELHVIIIDELDAICKERGTHNDGTGVGDNVINQLLSKMDGVEPLNNILVIGMTNRRDLMDKALLRPGRFEIQIEVGLPDTEGRKQIIGIHTKSLNENGLLNDDFDLFELAKLSENYTGSELSGVVRFACDRALSRHADMKSGEISGLDQLKVYQSDFVAALKHISPQFGRAETSTTKLAPYGLALYDEIFNSIFENLQSFVSSFLNGYSSITSVLIHGPELSGKTAVAAKLAEFSNIPFVKYLSVSELVSVSDSKKVTLITNAFLDAYKSPLSVIILDNIEHLIGYIPVGELYSPEIFKQIRTLIGKEPPAGHRLLVIGTTSNHHLLSRLQLRFDFYQGLPLIENSELAGKVAVSSEFIKQFRSDGNLDNYLSDLNRFDEFPLPIAKLFSDRLKTTRPE